MFPFYIMLGFFLFGLAVVFLLILKESREPEDPDQEDDPTPPSQGFLQRTFRKNKVVQATLSETPEASGTASLRLDQISQEQKEQTASPEIPAETSASSELTARLEQLQQEHKGLTEKYEKLNSLFDEKSRQLQKIQDELTKELEVRKEFNKVKNILEKELKDTKDRYRQMEVDLTNTQTESQSYMRRINQLDEKLQKVEKEVGEKSVEIRAAETGLEKEKKTISQLGQKIRKEQAAAEEMDADIRNLAKKLQQGGDMEPSGIKIPVPPAPLPGQDKPVDLSPQPEEISKQETPPSAEPKKPAEDEAPRLESRGFLAKSQGFASSPGSSPGFFEAPRDKSAKKSKIPEQPVEAELSEEEIEKKRNEVLSLNASDEYMQILQKTGGPISPIITPEPEEEKSGPPEGQPEPGPSETETVEQSDSPTEEIPVVEQGSQETEEVQTPKDEAPAPADEKAEDSKGPENSIHLAPDIFSGQMNAFNTLEEEETPPAEPGASEKHQDAEHPSTPPDKNSGKKEDKEEPEVPEDERP